MDRDGATVAVVARRVVVTGRVQGVFFRASTRRRARSAGLVGWVRNRDDGRVEAHLQGDPDAVGEVAEWMRDGGPPHARVDDVSVRDADTSSLSDFRIRD